MPIWFLVVYLIFGVGLIYVLFCGEAHQTGVVACLNRFLTQHLVKGFRSCTQKICGNNGAKKIEEIEVWCCTKPNPVLQTFYSVLIIGGYIIFVQQAFPHIPGPYLSEFHKINAHLTVLVTFIIFFWASWSDPGTVTKQNHARIIKTFPYDNVVFKRKDCETCKMPKPARSKHCGICGRCVSRFDHHCPWINNCVGHNNIRAFLSFLLSTIFLCGYACYLCIYVVLGVGKKHDLWNLGYVDKQTGIWKPVPLGFQIQFLLHHGGFVGPLGVFCGIVSLVVFAFFFYHLYLISTNTTTNEGFKRKDTIWDLNEIGRIQKQLQNAENAIPLKTISKKDEEEVKNLDIPKLIAAAKFNTYHKGFLGNFKEVLFPR